MWDRAANDHQISVRWKSLHSGVVTGEAEARNEFGTGITGSDFPHLLNLAELGAGVVGVHRPTPSVVGPPTSLAATRGSGDWGRATGQSVVG